MSANVLTAAAHTVAKGGIGFVPVSTNVQTDAAYALSRLRTLVEARDEDPDFPHHVWGYDLDDRGQYDKGLSQPRLDEQKAVFHYSPSVPERLRALGCPVDEWEDLFQLLASVYEQCFVTGLACAEALDHIVPKVGFADSCRKAGEASVLRLLVYKRRGASALETAYSHLDRSGLTFCVTESGPGLFVGHNKETRLPVMTPAGAMPVFAGRKLSQMTEGRITPLWHGTEEVPALEPYGRSAAVFFLHPNVPLVREAWEQMPLPF